MWCYYCGYEPAPVTGQRCSFCERVQPAVEVCSLEVHYVESQSWAALVAFREEKTFKGEAAWMSPPWVQPGPIRDVSSFHYKLKMYLPQLEAMGFKVVEKNDREFRWVIERDLDTYDGSTKRCSRCDQVYRDADMCEVAGWPVCRPCFGRRHILT